MKRIYSIDFIKLLFAYIIALGHFGAQLSPGGYVTVQIFYTISGYFLATKFYKRSYGNVDKKYNQIHYTIDHVKSLYPHYLFSLIVLALYRMIQQLLLFFLNPSYNQITTIKDFLFGLIPEAFLLQNTGFFGGGINYPLWQLCGLIICGYFVYGLLCFNEKLSREMIFPASILLIQVILNTDIYVWGSFGPFHVPLLRAFSALCVGVLIYNFTTTSYYQTIKSKKFIFNTISILSFISIFLFTNYRNIYLFTFFFAFLGFIDSNSLINKILNRKIFKHFGNFSYAIYLNHALIKFILNDYGFSIISKVFNITITNNYKNLIFLISLTIYSVFTMLIIQKMKSVKKEL